MTELSLDLKRKFNLSSSSISPVQKSIKQSTEEYLTPLMIKMSTLSEEFSGTSSPVSSIIPQGSNHGEVIEQTMAVTASIYDDDDSIADSMKHVRSDISLILSKLDNVLVNDEQRSTDITELKTENSALKARVLSTEVKNIKLNNDVARLTNKVSELENKCLDKNITIFHLEEPTGREDCKRTVIDFMVSHLKIPRDGIYSKTNPTGDIRVDIARRIGKPGNKLRPLHVEFCDKSSKLCMYKFVKNLKDTKYSVSDQFSTETREKRLAQLPRLKEYRKSLGDRAKVILSGDKLYIDGSLVDPKFEVNCVSPNVGQNLVPLSSEIFSFTEQSADDRGNVFKAYACEITSQADANLAHSSLFQSTEFAAATHRVYAYKYDSDSDVCYGYSDDGEFSAGSQIMAVLNKKKINNYFVCVTRKYGGNMGKKRFEVYNNLAKEVLSNYFPELA